MRSPKPLPMRDIITLYAQGWSALALGAKYGVSDMTILTRLKKEGVIIRTAHRQKGKKSVNKTPQLSQSDLELKIGLLYHEKLTPIEITKLTRIPLKKVNTIITKLEREKI